jgi:hypothetical protein
MSDPVIVHADGTDCHHPGDPQATADDPGGPRCPAGMPVGGVRVGAVTWTLDEAAAALDRAMAAIRPVLEAAARIAANGHGQGRPR